MNLLKTCGGLADLTVFNIRYHSTFRSGIAPKLSKPLNTLQLVRLGRKASVGGFEDSNSRL